MTSPPPDTPEAKAYQQGMRARNLVPRSETPSIEALVTELTPYSAQFEVMLRCVAGVLKVEPPQLHISNRIKIQEFVESTIAQDQVAALAAEGVMRLLGLSMGFAQRPARMSGPAAKALLEREVRALKSSVNKELVQREFLAKTGDGQDLERSRANPYYSRAVEKWNLVSAALEALPEAVEARWIGIRQVELDSVRYAEKLSAVGWGDAAVHFIAVSEASFWNHTTFVSIGSQLSAHDQLFDLAAMAREWDKRIQEIEVTSGVVLPGGTFADALRYERANSPKGNDQSTGLEFP